MREVCLVCKLIFLFINEMLLMAGSSSDMRAYATRQLMLKNQECVSAVYVHIEFDESVDTLFDLIEIGIAWKIQ